MIKVLFYLIPALSIMIDMGSDFDYLNALGGALLVLAAISFKPVFVRWLQTDWD